MKSETTSNNDQICQVDDIRHLLSPHTTSEINLFKTKTNLSHFALSALRLKFYHKGLTTDHNHKFLVNFSMGWTEIKKQKFEFQNGKIKWCYREVDFEWIEKLSG